MNIPCTAISTLSLSIAISVFVPLSASAQSIPPAIQYLGVVGEYKGTVLDLTGNPISCRFNQGTLDDDPVLITGNIAIVTKEKVMFIPTSNPNLDEVRSLGWEKVVDCIDRATTKTINFADLDFNLQNQVEYIINNPQW